MLHVHCRSAAAALTWSLELRLMEQPSSSTLSESTEGTRACRRSCIRPELGILEWVILTFHWPEPVMWPHHWKGDQRYSLKMCPAGVLWAFEHLRTALKITTGHTCEFFRRFSMASFSGKGNQTSVPPLTSLEVVPWHLACGLLSSQADWLGGRLARQLKPSYYFLKKIIGVKYT